MSFPRALLTFAVAAFAVAAIGCGPGASTVEEAEPSQANPLDDDEVDLLTRLNERRANAGQAALRGCAALNVAAAAHSDDMLREGYLDSEGLDGSVPRTRACDAGYAPACADGEAGIGELVAQGNPDAEIALAGWDAPTESALLLDPQMVVVGVGRALFDKDVRWTLDLATLDHDSCGD